VHMENIFFISWQHMSCEILVFLSGIYIKEGMWPPMLAGGDRFLLDLTMILQAIA